MGILRNDIKLGREGVDLGGDGRRVEQDQNILYKVKERFLQGLRLSRSLTSQCITTGHGDVTN